MLIVNVLPITHTQHSAKPQRDKQNKIWDISFFYGHAANKVSLLSMYVSNGEQVVGLFNVWQIYIGNER